MIKYCILIFVAINFSVETLSFNKSSDKLERLVREAEELGEKKEYQKALEVYHEALKLASSEGLSSNTCLIYKKIGLIYYKKSQNVEASNYFKKSILRDSFSQNAADSYFNLSLIYRRQKKKDSLLWSLKKSLSLYGAKQDSEKKFSTYLKAGILYKNEGRYSDAMKYLIQAYEWFGNSKNDQKKALVCNTIAFTQRLLGNLDIAEKYYYEALEINKVLKDSLQIAYSYVKVANVLKDRNQYNAAIVNYKKGIVIQNNIKVHKEVGKALNNLASIYYLKKEYQNASKTYKEALVFKKKEQDTLSMVYTYNELAQIELQNKRTSIARKYLDSVNTYTSSISNKDVILRNYDIQSQYYKSINNFKKALYYKEKYVTLYQNVFNEKQAKTVQGLQEKFESKQKQEKISKLSESNNIQEEIIDNQKENLQQKNLFLIISGLLVLLSFGAFLFFRLRQKSKVRELELERLKAVFKGQELIKKSISKDLHDIVSTNYDGIRLKILALPKAKKPSNVSADIVNEIKDINHQIRLISHRLSPLGDKIKDTTLREIIIAQLSEFQFYRKIFINVEMPLPEELDNFNIDAQTNFYGVLLEALNNIEKHSKATQVDITHSIMQSGRLEFIIYDNGIGFKKSNNNGIGVLNMKQRSELLGGECIIKSSDVGTKVSIKIPLKANML